LRQESADARYSDLLHNNDKNSFSSPLGSNPGAQRVQGPIQKKQKVLHPFHFRVFECMLGLNLLVVSFGLGAGGAGQKLLLAERNHEYRPNPLGKKRAKLQKDIEMAQLLHRCSRCRNQKNLYPKTTRRRRRRRRTTYQSVKERSYSSDNKNSDLCRQRKVPSI
jgi:hypothetical protein